MKRALPLFAALLLTLGACADGATDPATTGPGVEINLAALNFDDLSYTAYTITVRNLSDDIVSQVTIDSDSYAVGGDAGTVRYVAPCDDSTGENPNEITVAVNAIETSSSTVPAGSLPPAQIKTANCAANESTQVSFQFQALTSSELGFFDIVLGTDLVYCSAKLDCENSTSTFFPSAADGGFVIGFACTADNADDADTVLHLDDIVVNCGGANTATITPDQAGNLPSGKISDATTPLIQGVTVFRGEDILGTSADNVYWNVAVGLTDAATALTCTVTTDGTATSGAGVPVDAPFVTWNVQVANASNEVSCSEHPIFGTGGNAGVSVDWPATQGTAETFDNLYMGNPVAFVTSTTYTPGTAYNGSNAFFNSASNATAACGDRATVAGLGSSWVAWISDTHPTTPVAAKDGLSIEQVRLTNGTVVALGKGDLLDGTLAAAINIDELGNTVSSAPVWTGTSSDGTASGSDCNDWADGTSGSSGTVGTQAAGSTWTDNGTQLCNLAGRFICIQVP